MGKYLSFRERQDIECLLNAKTPVKVIAATLGRSYSTIYKEIKRGQTKLLDTNLRAYFAYSAFVAQEHFIQAQTSKGCPIKMGNDHEFAHFIEDKICNDHYSPAAALAAARRAGCKTSVSVSTLYSYIDKGYFSRISNRNLLYKRLGKKRTYNHVHVYRKSIVPHIEDRPLYVNSRQEPGHWEMDCVCGKHGTTPVLLVLTERVTRYELIFKMPNKTTCSVVRVLNRLESAFPDFKERFKSITVDNGVEFADYPGMIRSIYGGQRTQVYYCHPYTSCERGSNENCNRIIRRWVPKGQDIGQYSSRYIQQVQDWINSYPRRVLGYDSASDCAKVWLCA